MRRTTEFLVELLKVSLANPTWHEHDVKYVIQAVRSRDLLLRAARHFKDCEFVRNGWIDCPDCEEFEVAINKIEEGL